VQPVTVLPLGPRTWRRRGLRQQNLAMALRCIADGDGVVSRANISGRTALNKSTSSSLVDELISAGLVREAGVVTRQVAGRPPTSLELVTEGPAGLGIEVNVDYIAACVVDLTGAARYQHVVSRDHRGQTPEEVMRRAAALGASAVRMAGGSALEPYGATIAVAGLVDRYGKRVVLAPNLGWSDYSPMSDVHPADLGISRYAQLTIENEANCAALSERELLRVGASYLYIYGEVGVGSAIVLGGHLYRGDDGWSGEIGHLTIEQDGIPCGCGSRGCLEQYAGQEAILRAAGLDLSAGTSLGVGPTTELIQDRAEAGDTDMLRALERAGRALGLVVAFALNLLNIDRVVLGGIYRDLAPYLLPTVQAGARARYAGARWASPAIVAAAHGPEAPALGAARSVVRRIIDDPSGWMSQRARAVR
jgi:predicted NBD/HSP70 family sugar kinase